MHPADLDVAESVPWSLQPVCIGNYCTIVVHETYTVIATYVLIQKYITTSAIYTSIQKWCIANNCRNISEISQPPILLTINIENLQAALQLFVFSTSMFTVSKLTALHCNRLHGTLALNA